ncbi:MAG: hypothetical protein JWM11_2780 [Planctomycetaceae bacterium]|nr:hypothetical protein [Planctomycetaceae bacterium]
MKYQRGRQFLPTWLLVLCVVFGAHIRPVAALDKHLAQVTDLAGQVHAGTLIELTDTKLRLDAKPPISLKRDEILRLDWQNQPGGLLEDSPQLLLANGDRLGILPNGIDEEALRGSWNQFPAWPEVKVPLETLRGAVLLPQRGLLERSRILARLRDQKQTQDVLYLANGDRLAGQLEGLKKKFFQLKTAAGKTMLGVDAVQAFGMNPELTSFPTVKEPQTLAILEDGSQLAIGALKLVGGTELHCRAAFGADLIIPLEKVISLQFLGGRVVYLSDLEPSEFLSTPYLTRVWPLRRNQNAIGGPLRLGDREYSRGLGVHGQSLVTYDLKGEFATFQATVGIDAAAEGRGSVVFRVLADGKPIFTSDIVRGKTAPVPIGPLSMQSIKRLTLSVDFADEGDLLDHADWCDAVLIRSAAGL